MASVNHNTIQNGVEIKFTTSPDGDTVSWLKRKGFRWSGRQRLWYARFTQNLLDEATQKFVRQFTPEELEARKEEALKQHAEMKQKQAAQNAAYYLTWKSNNPQVDRAAKMTYQQYAANPLPFVYLANIYKYNPKKNQYEHTPSGRKTPDKYSVANIHSMLQDFVIKHGEYLSFDTYMSNPNRQTRFIKYYMQDLEKLIKEHPQMMETEQNREFVAEKRKELAAHQAEVKFWADYRERVIRPLKEANTVLYSKNKQGKYIRMYIGSVMDEVIGSIRQDAMNIEDRSSGYIIYSITRLIKDVYLENPDLNIDAKNILELYPPESNKTTAADALAFQFEMEMLELELELLDLAGMGRAGGKKSKFKVR